MFDIDDLRRRFATAMQGLTYAAAAAEIGVTPTTLHRFISGLTPSVATVIAVDKWLAARQAKGDGHE